MGRYAITTENGVELISGASTPYPVGAVEPISNWDAMQAVATGYRVIDSGAVREMTQNEKDTHDTNNHLDEIKAVHCGEIDVRTDELIAAGYSHGGSNLSLSGASQDTLLMYIASPPSYPVKLTTLTSGEYSVASAEDMASVIAEARAAIKTNLDSGRDLKVACMAAADAAAVRAVEDTR